MDPVTLRDYFHALREADAKWHDERDRRYSEVQAEREKANQRAMLLARDLQAYRDGERGEYVTRQELTGMLNEIRAMIRPLQGSAVQGQRQVTNAAIGLWITGAAAGFAIVTFLVRLL